MGVGRGGGLPHGRGRGQVKFNPQQNKGGGDGQSFGHTEGVHKKLPPFKTRGGSAENVLTMSRGGGGGKCCGLATYWYTVCHVYVGLVTEQYTL